MEKKLAEMNEAFEHHKFHECLSIIDPMIKKFTKPDKKNKCLSENGIRIVKCYKAGCLASIGRLHEANQILKEIMDMESILMIGEEYGLLLASISELFGDGREKKTIQMIEEHFPNLRKQSLYRFHLSTRNFSTLSKLFLKEYMTNKNINWQFGQVYLEYLQNLDKAGMIQFKRDGCYRPNEQLKMGLKMVTMFLDKTVKNVHEHLLKYELEAKEGVIGKKQIVEKQVKNSKKTILKANEFKLKIAINEGKILDSIKLFIQLRITLKFPFTFIRSIYKLRQIAQKPEQITVIDQFYVNEMQIVFQTNLNFSHYTPWYDYYNEFLDTMMQRASQDDKQYKSKIGLKQLLLPFTQLYKFETIKPLELISIYFNSLSSQYHILTDQNHEKYQQNKKSDYYKICLKGLLLQLIKICHLFSLNENKLKYLQDFKTRFVNTLTYAHQMKDYWEILIKEKILTELEKVENDNHLIEEINYHKIRIAVETKIPTQEGFQAIYTSLGLLYQIRVKQIEKNRKLEKGERYISDQFYTLICDYARAYIETQQTFEPIFKILSFLIKDLESAIEVSPYNADTKLRLMYFLMLLGHGERLVDVFFTNDIKSVQWESLGYWFLRVMLEVGVGENLEPQVDKFVKSYQQNQRQTSEYGIKALKAGELDRVDEYLCYRTCMLHSYNSIILLYALFHRYRFESTSEYYLLQINQRLRNARSGQNQLFFNADFKVMKNQIFKGTDFTDIYGIFNNLDILQIDIHIYLHEQVAAWKVMARECEQVSKQLPQLYKLEENICSVDGKKVFDFSQYTFQEGEPLFDGQVSKYTVTRNQNFLRLFVLIGQARISTVLLVNELNNFSRGNETSKQILEELRQKLMKNIKQLVLIYGQIEYRSQLHSITMIRRGLFESYGLLFLIRQCVQKNKKMKFAKEIVNNICDPSLEYILEMIVTLRWSEQVNKDDSPLHEKDRAVERQLTMDLNQAKRVISRYQSHYKP